MKAFVNAEDPNLVDWAQEFARRAKEYGDDVTVIEGTHPLPEDLGTGTYTIVVASPGLKNVRQRPSWTVRVPTLVIQQRRAPVRDNAGEILVSHYAASETAHGRLATQPIHRSSAVTHTLTTGQEGGPFPPLDALVDEMFYHFRRSLPERGTHTEHVASQLADALGAVLAERDALLELYERLGLDLDQANRRIEALEDQLKALKAAPSDPEPAVARKWLASVAVAVVALIPVVGPAASFETTRMTTESAERTAQVQAVTATEAALIGKIPAGTPMNDDPNGLYMKAHDLAIKLSEACAT